MSRELILLLVGTMVLGVSATAYRNPLTLPKESMGAGIADPGLLRWMGKDYLYATKVSEDPGIRCWESDDLVDWTYKGFCTGNDPMFANGHGWSPGPFYYNGKFYLYVCGVDQKHKVFEADKPTGPFTCVNKDLIDVNSLDAVPLLDDDGQLYLFYAGWGGVGIQYRTCSSPVKADGPNHTLPACQFSADNNGNFWTEGPTLWKRDGEYYLAHCGNDWLKDSYQVRVARGKSIAELKPQKSNPLIAQPTGPWVATGCNWITRGPDLKSLWNVYHCRKFEGAARRMCLDRLSFDPKTGDLLSSGPTWTSQPSPSLPTYSESFDRSEIGPTWEKTSGKWELRKGEGLVASALSESAEILCKCPIKSDFVAEFNVKLLRAGNSARFGVVLADDKSELSILLDPATKTIQLTGKTTAKASLPPAFDFDVWHTIIVQNHGGRMKIHFDEMLKIDRMTDMDAAHFSLLAKDCDAAFGWCGFSNYEPGEQAL